MNANQVVYMLYEDDDGFSGGPYLGKPGLDFRALSNQFRAMKYAEAEAAEEDYCWFNDSDFIAWLLKTEVLAVLKHTSANFTIASSSEHKYVPKHWPKCPGCEAGRGEECSGPVVHSLNRWEWYRKCVECGHTWNHHDVPYNSTMPMLDDDGRNVNGGCVPYSLSQVTDIPMSQVLELCRRHGWSEKTGMYAEHGVVVASQLGFQLEPAQQRIAGKLTLRRILNQLSPSKKYIVGTRNHWLAVVHGENRDQTGTGMRAEVISCWEVVPVQAGA